jgi:hypothetical protein
VSSVSLSARWEILYHRKLLLGPGLERYSLRLLDASLFGGSPVSAFFRAILPRARTNRINGTNESENV